MLCTVYRLEFYSAFCPDLYVNFMFIPVSNWLFQTRVLDLSVLKFPELFGLINVSLLTIVEGKNSCLLLPSFTLMIHFRKLISETIKNIQHEHMGTLGRTTKRILTNNRT